MGAPGLALAQTGAAPAPREGASPAGGAHARREDGAPTLGRFLLLRKLGEGGMGEVFSAYDEQLDRRVAIKLLHAAYASEETQKRMLREAQALARLSHPNVVTVHEVGEVDGDVFVVMEHIEGKNLREWQEEAPRSAEEVLDAYRMAGRGLAAVHAAGMVHRDFKPANAMIGGDGRVRILDFGLAHARGSAPADSGAPAPTSGALASPLTAEGSIVGTPAYMSPEQFFGDPLDARSDQFSFCVALYEALYQRSPFAAKRPGGPVIPALGGEPTPAPPRADLPARVPEALARGLSRDPAGRFETMDALLAELDEEPRADPSGQGWHRRLFALIVLATAGAFTVWSEVRPSTESTVQDDMLVPALGLTFVIAATTFLFRGTLLKNPFHRARVLPLLVMGLVVVASRVIGAAHGETMVAVELRDMLITAAGISVSMIWLTPRLVLAWLAVAVAGTGVVGIVVFDRYLAEIASFSHDGTLFFYLAAWAQSARHAQAMAPGKARWGSTVRPKGPGGSSGSR